MDANINQILELYKNDFKAAMIKMLEYCITNSLEAKEKVENFNEI